MAGVLFKGCDNYNKTFKDITPSIASVQENERSVCLIAELIPKRDLSHFLDDHKFLKPDLAVFYLAELVQAIDHLHTNNVIHHCLNLENILIDSAVPYLINIVGAFALKGYRSHFIRSSLKIVEALAFRG